MGRREDVEALTVKAFRHGDESAFDAIFRSFYPVLCRFARKYVTEAGIAEEITSSILFKLWQRRAGFPDLNAIKAFLYISTKNASLDYLDKENTLKRHLSNFSEIAPSSADNILKDIYRAEVYRELVFAIDTLPDKCRQVMKMSFEQDMSSKEIAGQLGITVSTVDNQRARGVLLLKKKLSGDSFRLLLVFLSV